MRARAFNISITNGQCASSFTTTTTTTATTFGPTAQRQRNESNNDNNEDDDDDDDADATATQLSKVCWAEDLKVWSCVCLRRTFGASLRL